MKEEKEREQQNVYLRQMQKVVQASKEFSDEDDRDLHLDIWQKGWNALPIDRKQQLLDAKITGSCVKDFLAWLVKSNGKLPESYRSHGPQERLKILFKAI